MTAAQERLDMRSGYQAAKILPVAVRGTKNVWCLSSLIFGIHERMQEKQIKQTLMAVITVISGFDT